METKVVAFTLDQVLADTVTFAVYGRPVKTDLSVVADADKSVGTPGQSLFFVSVGGFAHGTFCQRLPHPILIALPGAGEKPGEGDKCAQPGERVWKVSFSATTMALIPASGSIEEILEDFALRGISGGVKLENPRIANGKACVDVHVWAKIEVFGRKVSVDQRIPVCVALQGCQTVWNIGWARLEICIRAPRQVCGKLCVGKWGLEKCWEECVNLPVAVADSEQPCHCKE